jgi:hypothetical protein
MPLPTGVEYREKSDGMLCRLGWNTEKDLFFRMWNVEKYCFDEVECGERPVEHRESSEGKSWNVEKNVSAPNLYILSVKPLLQAFYDFHISPYSTVRPKWFPS